MSNINLDLQLFGGGSGNWSSGITESAIKEAFQSFSTQIDETIDAIRNYSKVDEALNAGWSGQDCEDYIDKFHTHAEKVITQIEAYRTAVGTQVDSIIEQWDTFQAGLIS